VQAFFSALIFPGIVALQFWGDFLGGFYLAGLLRLVLQHHSTFSINSLAHFIGTTSYDDKLTARDSLIVAIITFGEGYVSSFSFLHLLTQVSTAITTFTYVLCATTKY
jgi:stearoyl-CoA desaturase (delta-9 desaturase)